MDTITDNKFDNILSKLNRHYPNHTTYYQEPKVFSEDECNQIIETFEPLCINQGGTFTQSLSAVRQTQITWIPVNPTTQWIYDKLLDVIVKANDNIFGFNITSLVDKIQFVCYNGDDLGKYERHIDIGSNDIYSCRKISISVQLSPGDSYEGGDFIIGRSNISREQGTAICFPAFLEHEVKPVTNNKRYSLVLWVYGPSFN